MTNDFHYQRFFQYMRQEVQMQVEFNQILNALFAAVLSMYWAVDNSEEGFNPDLEEPQFIFSRTDFMNMHNVLDSLDTLPEIDDGSLRSAASKAKDHLLALLEHRNVAFAQAIEIAQYVEDHAKGAMVERVKAFLSMPYAEQVRQELRNRQQYLDVLKELGPWLSAALSDDKACAEFKAVCEKAINLPGVSE